MINGALATAPLRHLLTELGTAGSTGVLHIDGSPGGSLFLVEGRISHAETPACPGVGQRLVSSGRLAVAAWESAYRAGHRDGTVGARLVDDGHLAPGELVCRALAAICDAAHVLLRDDEAPARFEAGRRHWLGPVTQIELTALSCETAHRPLTTPTVEMPIVGTAASATPPETATQPVVELRPAVLVEGRDVDPADGPWAGRPRPDGARRTAPNALPIRPRNGRGNAGPQADASHSPDSHHQDEPDYATLKRIRQALNSMG